MIYFLYIIIYYTMHKKSNAILAPHNFTRTWDNGQISGIIIMVSDI